MRSVEAGARRRMAIQGQAGEGGVGKGTAQRRWRRKLSAVNKKRYKAVTEFIFFTEIICGD